MQENDDTGRGTSSRSPEALGLLGGVLEVLQGANFDWTFPSVGSVTNTRRSNSGVADWYFLWGRREPLLSVRCSFLVIIGAGRGTFLCQAVEKKFVVCLGEVWSV